MNKTLKSLASLFVVMAMVVSMIPASFLTIASATDTVLSFNKNSGDFNYESSPNESGKYSGWVNNCEYNKYITSKNTVSFTAGVTYEITLQAAVERDDNTVYHMPTLVIGSDTVGTYPDVAITNKDNPTSTWDNGQWANVYNSSTQCFEYTKKLYYTPSTSGSKTIDVNVNESNKKDRIHFGTLTISESDYVVVAEITDFSNFGYNDNTYTTFNLDGYTGGKVVIENCSGRTGIQLMLADANGSNQTELLNNGSNPAGDLEYTFTAAQLSSLSTNHRVLIKGGSGTYKAGNYSVSQAPTAVKILATGGGSVGTTYNIDTAVSPADSGTVSGGGAIAEGSSVTLTATPNAGYTFTKWQKDGVDIAGATSATYTIASVAAADEATYTAVFTALPTYTVSFSGTNGTVTATLDGNAISSGASVYQGGSVTFTATPNTGYAFAQWSDNSTENPHTVTVNAATSMTATFEESVEEVLIATLDPGSDNWSWSEHSLGTVDFSGYENIRFEATALSGQFNKIANHTPLVDADYLGGNKTSLEGTFDGTTVINGITFPDLSDTADVPFYWEGNGRIQIKFYGTPITGPAATYEVNFSGTNGTVTATAGGSAITSGDTVEKNTSVTFTATPNSGYVFMGWSDGSKTNPRTVSITADTTMTATFGTISYPQTVNGIVDSAINPDFKVLYGDTNKYVRDGSFINCSSGISNQTRGGLPFYIDDTSSTTTYTISVYLKGNNNTYASILKPSGSEVTNGIKVNDSWSNLSSDPAVFTLTGDQFDSTGWYYAGFYATNNNTYMNLLKVVVEKSGGTQSYTVTFSGTNGTVTATAGGNAISSGDTVDDGTSVMFTATPNEHYHFVSWSDSTSTNPKTVTVDGDDVTMTATFAIDTHTVALTSGGNGTVTGAGTYNYNQEITITATPSEHYHFVQWSDGDTNASRTFNVTEDLDLTATFAIDTFTVSLTAGDHGSVSGAGTYDYNQSVTITATPDSGYHFVKWSDNDTNASRTFNITENVTLTATFEEDAPIQYTITGASNGNGTVSGTATVNAGTSVTLTATPDSGYHFVKWDDENTDNPRTVIANADATYTATFEEDTPDTDTSTKYQFESGSSTSFAHVKDNIDFDQLKPTTYDGAVIATGINESGIQSTVLHNFPTAGTYRISLVYYGNNDGGHEYTLPSVKVGDHAAVPFGTASWTKDEGGPAWRGPFTVYVDYVITTPGVQTVLVTGYPGAGEKLGYDYLEIVGGSQGSETHTQYTVTVDSATGGSATGAGTYDENSPVTLRATPASGYIFKRWEKYVVVTEDDPETQEDETEYGFVNFATTANITVEVDGNLRFRPVFARVYTITVTAGENGSVTGGGTYEEGSSVTITATPDRGYVFSEWQDNNTSATRTITVSGDATYTATFVHEDNTRPGYTNRLRIEAESATLFTDASKFETKSGIDKNMGAATSPASFPEWLRLKQGQTGEAYLPFTVPADALTGTEYIINLCYAIGGYDRGIYVNLWIPDANGDTTINGSKFSKYENKSFGEFKSSNSFGEDIANVLGKSVALTPGTTYYIGLYGNEYASFDYVEIVSTKPAFSTDHTVTLSTSGDDGATISASGSTSGVGTTFHEGEVVTVTVTPSSTHSVAYWLVNDQKVYIATNTYTIDGIYANTTVTAVLTIAADLDAVIRAADSTHPYAYAEAIFPRADFPNLYDNSNWENGFDIVFSYDLEDASGNPITFYGTATGSFIVEGASGNVYKQSDEGVANNESAAISNCWYMGSDTVSAVKLLLTELRYTNYNNGEYGDLDIGKTVNFHVLSLTHRDTPYVDLSNKTSNYIIYGNEIPVTNLGIDGYSNGNGSSTINFQTVVDATNEFDNHRVWQIIYHLDTSGVDNNTGGINKVYVGRYYIVPDGDVAVDATGGSGFSFYYRTAENQTKGTWITMQSNLFTTHGQNLLNLEPMKVYLEPTYGEWKAYYATYDLSAAAGQTITYWDFFIDGGDPCVEVPGGYLFDQDSDYWINSATDATFWFSELRLERYKTVTITYKDQWDKVIETREVRLGSIQAPSTLTAREGYLFSYWTLNGDIVGPYWYFGEKGLEDYSGAIAVPNADGAEVYDNGHFNQPVTEARTYVAHYVYNGNYYNVTATNGTITITNTQSGLTTDPVTEGSYDYETLIKLEANKDTVADFMYWSYGEYKVDSNGDPVLVDGKKQYRHFAILSYKPTVSTNVMGHADYFAIYADDIASSAIGVVNPILAYYTPNKTGNGSDKVYRSTNTSKGTDEIYAYASMFTRAIAFDTYHDSQYNKLSFISTIAYKEDLYNPIGFGVVVTGYKASAQSILNFSSGSTFSEEVLLAKTGEATTSDEMAITYENFLSATNHFYTANGARSVQEIPFKEESLKTALTSGQFLTSITGLDNQSRRYARTFLIVEDKTSGAVYVVYSDTYANAAIGSVPTQYTISADIKIGADTSTASSVSTTTEGHTTTATASGNYITGVGSITSGMSGFLRAVAEIGYEFYGWDTDGDGAIDVTTPLLSYEKIASNLNYTAYFRPVDTVYVTATVATTNGGTIASSIQNGQVNSGTTVYLYAMPNDGYTFVGWVKSSSELGISYVPKSYTSTDAAYSFTATNARTYIYAYFRSDTDGKATIRPIIGSVAGGTATVNGRSYVTVVPDTTVTLTATPKLGYSFVSWTIDDVVVSTNSTFNYTVTSTDNVIVTANFEAVEGLTDTKTLEAENYTAAKYNYLTNNVNASSDALDTDSDGDVVYTILSYSNSDEENTHVNKNKIVQLIPFTAPVAGTYDFKVYYKKTNENSDIYIDVYNTDSTTSYSEVTIDGTTYYETWYYGSESGDTNNNTTWGANSYDVKLTLAANEKILIGLCDNKGLGAEFDRVVVTCENGNVFSTSGDVAQATITFATVGGGTIYNTIDPDDTTTVLSDTSVDYNVGARVGMHAVPDAGKEFVGWSLDGGTTTFTNENVTKDTLYTHRVSSNATITAVFETYTNLDHSHIASGESYYTATITVENGNSATVKSYWSSNSEAYYIDTVRGTNVTMSVPTRKITLTAVDDTEESGTNVFAGWYKIVNQTEVFLSNERVYKTDFINGNVEFKAKYLTAEDLHTVTANIVGDSGSGSVTANKEVFTSGSFAEGASQKFTAEPNLGYIFTGWSTNGTNTPVLTGTIGNGTIEKEAKLNLTVGDSDETFYAHFAPYETSETSHTHNAEETYYNVTASVNNGNTVVVQNYWSSTSEGYYLDSTTSSMTITVPNKKLTLTAIDKPNVGEGEINVFAGWYVNGSFLGMGEGANHEIKTAAKISSETTIEARYTTALEIKAAVNYYGAATITDGSTTASEITISSPVNGTTYTFTAGTPNNYYAFDGWYNGDTKVASTNEYSYTYATADGSVNLVAKYNYVSADTMPIISILTSDYASVNADATQTSGFTAITKEYKAATVNVLNGADYNNYELVDATAKVKGRGNSTWNTSTTIGLKRAIRFKFDSKQNILNINKNGTSKSWVLLANNLDRSLLRNSLAFELGDRLTNILYSSKHANVEVYINGVYQGVYLLCEQSEADPTRVNITEPTKTDNVTAIDAFIELDNVQNFTDSTLYSSDTIGNTYDGDYYFQISTTNWHTDRDPAFVIKSDIYTVDQYNYLQTLFSNTQSAIYDGIQATVEGYIDVDSFVDMYILQEIAKNTDVGYSSFYFAVKNGKVYCTTPWDFDKAFGNDMRGDNTSGLYVGEGTQNNTATSLNTNPWFIALMSKTWFKDLVKARWTALYEAGTFSDVLSVISSDYTRYSASYGRNWSKWSSKIANGTKLDNEAESYRSFASSQAAYNQLVSWYTARITYLNSVFNTSTPIGDTTTTIYAVDNVTLNAVHISGTNSDSDGTVIDGDILNAGNNGDRIGYGIPVEIPTLASGETVTVQVYGVGKADDGAYICCWNNSNTKDGETFDGVGTSVSNEDWSVARTTVAATFTFTSSNTAGTYYIGVLGNYINLYKVVVTTSTNS